MNKKYYLGSFREDGLNDPNRGWIVGKFKDSEPRKNDEVEIKYWEFKVGPTEHTTKVSSIIECTFVLTGLIKGTVEGEDITLKAGDYIVIQPGVTNNLVVEIIKPASGLTVKAPSDPSAKSIITKD